MQTPRTSMSWCYYLPDLAHAVARNPRGGQRLHTVHCHVRAATVLGTTTYVCLQKAQNPRVRHGSVGWLQHHCHTEHAAESDSWRCCDMMAQQQPSASWGVDGRRRQRAHFLQADLPAGYAEGVAQGLLKGRRESAACFGADINDSCTEGHPTIQTKNWVARVCQLGQQPQLL